MPEDAQLAIHDCSKRGERCLRVLQRLLWLPHALLRSIRMVVYAGFDTLDGLIRRDRRWLPALLDYVNYTPNPALQVEAAKIAAILVDRLPHFPDLLMQPLGSGKSRICCLLLTHSASFIHGQSSAMLTLMVRLTLTGSQGALQSTSKTLEMVEHSTDSSGSY